MTALIQIENLHYRPGGLAPDRPDILRGIDLNIEKGEFIAIIGKNGSGKTSLIKHINGLLLPTRGRILVGGMDTRQVENHQHLHALVGMVFQNPSDQIVASTVEEDVAFGLENLNLPTPEIRIRVAEQLAMAGLTDDAARPPHLLSGGQIQKVALAGVLAREPQLILFDEPTSMLDAQVRQSLMRQIYQLHQQGMTILYITHHMEEAVEADHVLVMNDGQVILNGSPEEIFISHKTLLYEIGLEVPEAVRIADHFASLDMSFQDSILTPEQLIAQLPILPSHNQQRVYQTQPHRDLKSSLLVDLQNVHYTYHSGTPLAKKALNNVSLNTHQGEIHAIAGGNGSGKSTLLQQINGILRPEQGYIRVGSLRLEDPKTKLIDIIRKVGLVFQSPESQFFEVFVGDEIAYGPKQFGMEDIRERVRQVMANVGLDFETFKDRRLETLSGGEKRKVALASTLVLEQDVLMFDEPTAGMDPQARDRLITLFNNLQSEEKTIMIASHRMEEIAKISDRLSLMDNGKVVDSGPCGQVLSTSGLLSTAGLIPPLAILTAQVLINKGWPLNLADLVSPESLFIALEKVMQ